jgi:hypothetical protein
MNKRREQETVEVPEYPGPIYWIGCSKFVESFTKGDEKWLLIYVIGVL